MHKRIFLIATTLLVLLTLSSCKGDEGTTAESYVLFAHNSTGITKYVYENDKLSEVITLDPVTLNEAIVGADNLRHSYAYDKKGILSKLVYQGQNLRIEYDENSHPKRAGGKNVYFLFTCNDSGAIIKEEIYQNKKFALENRYDDNGIPVSSNYIDLGLIEYNFTDKVTYVSVSADDEMLYYELTLGNDGRLSTFSQTSDYATVITAWQYNDDGLVTVAAIQTTSGNGFIREQYELTYNDKNLPQNIFRSFVDQHNNLSLSSETYYAYSDNGKLSVSSNTKYNTDATVNSMTIVKYENEKQVNVIESSFEDNNIASYEESVYTYTDSGGISTLSKSAYTGDDVFVSGDKSEYKYNSNALLSGIVTEYFNADNALQNKKVEEYLYDDNGFCTDARMYLLDGESNLIERKTDLYERDESGNIKMQLTSRYDSTDTLTGTTVVENLYNVKGKLLTSVTRNYDANGKEIKNN